MTSWLEGFAKLHSFKMRGSEFLYSGAMLQSPNYVASVEVGSGRFFSFMPCELSFVIQRGIITDIKHKPNAEVRADLDILGKISTILST